MAQTLLNFGNYYLYVYHTVAPMVAAQAPPCGIPRVPRPTQKLEGSVLSRPSLDRNNGRPEQHFLREVLSTP
jgi:hypothetical protein